MGFVSGSGATATVDYSPYAYICNATLPRVRRRNPSQLQFSLQFSLQLQFSYLNDDHFTKTTIEKESTQSLKKTLKNDPFFLSSILPRQALDRCRERGD
jgi:hypothetical protein